MNKADGDRMSETPARRAPRPRRVSWAWLVPAAAVVLAAVLAVEAARERGVAIQVRFSEGHGLAIGDPVRFRGIAVGRITKVAIADAGSGVMVSADLDRQVADLSGEGTRFWIVRPRLDLRGVGGLDTIVGPRYLEVRPAGDLPRRDFVGLDTPPAVEQIGDGDLLLTLDAARRGSLQVGAGVYYRGVRIGTVLSVALAADAGSVEAEVLIETAYASLIRPRTRFFPAGSVEVGVSLDGLKTRIDSLETLLLGGVGVATPPAAGDPVASGHRFVMDDRAEDEWLDWRPAISLGAALETPPLAVPANLAWRSGGWFGRARSVSGWVLPTSWGVVGPRSLLQPTDGARDARLELDGVLQSPGTAESASIAIAPSDLAVMPLPEMLRQRVLGRDRFRAPSGLEDLFIAGDPAREPKPLPAARMMLDGSRWRVDRGERLPESMHGLAAVAALDGRIVGVLIVEDRDAWVVPWIMAAPTPPHADGP